MIWLMRNIFGRFSALWRHLPATAAKAQRVYLDHAAATPVRAEVLQAMAPYWSELYGNPGAIHQEGRAAKEAVDRARQEVASVTAVRPEHVIFTANGTESNNLAIRGYLDTLAQAGRDRATMQVITTRIEHPATLETVRALAATGVVVTYVPVSETGKVEPSVLRAALTSRTVLVSVAHINSEVGVIQSTQALARVLRAYAKENDQDRPLLHIDAAQSPWWQKCQLDRLGADMLSLDAGKCGGPKGGGVLVNAGRRWVTQGIFHGGGQEFGLRPGTEAVPLIVGTARALRLAQADVAERVARIATVRDALWKELQAAVPMAVWNGPRDADRVANNVHFSLPGIDTEYAAVVLDAHGYAVSTKSACSSADSSASAVVLEMTGDSDRARATLRITLGPETEWREVAELPAVLAALVQKMERYKV